MPGNLIVPTLGLKDYALAVIGTVFCITSKLLSIISTFESCLKTHLFFISLWLKCIQMLWHLTNLCIIIIIIVNSMLCIHATFFRAHLLVCLSSARAASFENIVTLK